MEPPGDPSGSVPQIGGEGGHEFELSRGDRCAESEVGGGARQPGEEQGVRFPGGEPGQPGPVAVHQAVSPVVAGFPVEGHAGGRQGLHVPVDGADRNLQRVGQLLGGHATPALEQQEDRHQPARAHGPNFIGIY